MTEAASEHLTHGWEPDLEANDSLLRRFVLASAERTLLTAGWPGGRVHRDDDVVIGDAASVVFFENSVVLLQPPEYVDFGAVIERTVAFFPPERHFVLMSAWPTPDLTASGFQLIGHPPLMIRPAGGEAPPLPPGVEVRKIVDAAGLAEFVTTLVEAYPMPGGEQTALSDPGILGGAIHLFVAYLDGKPVATAGATVEHGAVVVEWVATRPECRGKGIGAAVTWAATLVDPTLPGLLIASDDGQSVYEHMGYVRLLRITLWHRPSR